MLRLELTPRAIADLRGIRRYSIENWGLERAESYLNEIDRTIDRKAAGAPASSLFISKPGYQFEWMNSRSEPRNVSTREGLRGHVVLKAEKRG